MLSAPTKIHLLTALSLLLTLGTPALAELKDSPAPALKDHYLVTEGVNLHYVESGSGQPIVLLHGNDGTLQDFTMSVFNQLSAKYQTFTFDRPGHGDSKILPGAKLATPERQAQILHNALIKLQVSRPILVAQSWSGSVALSYALQYPDDLSGIVLLGGMAYDTGGSKLIYRLAQVPIVGSALRLVFKDTCGWWVEKQLRNAFIPDDAPQPYVDRFLSSTLRLSQLKAAARDEVTINPTLKRISRRYGSINLPVIIVTGDHDMTVSPQQNSYPLHKAIPASRLIVVHNAGHELGFTRPQEVMKAIDLAVQLSRSWTHLSNPAATVEIEATPK